MTIGQFKMWCVNNKIPDDFDMDVVSFGNDGCSVESIEGLKVNSGGVSIQLEIYPDGWKPVSEGTTRFIGQ